MTIERKERTVTREQMKKLEGLLFWLRELHMLKNYSASVQREYDIDRTKMAIGEKLIECDEMEIPFSVQNIVLCYNDVHTDIIDVLKENNVIIV